MNPLRATPTWALPIAIVLAGLIVATALYFVRVHQLVTKEAGDPSIVRPVTPNDHLIGNPTAQVMVIEYGDIDSEYTKKFNAIMQQIMLEYGADGNVAWVFRHFPIIALHPDSAAHASAAECVSSLAGPESFWRFIDAIAAAAPGTNQFDPKDYGTILQGLNVSPEAFAQCVSKGTFEKRVQDDYTNAILSGGTGAPYIILTVKGQRPIPISGALPYASMKSVLEEALKKADK
jgi:protein-disulfide isomerase